MNCIVHILAVVTTFCLLDDVFSHSTGADTRACNLAEMKPQHTGVNEYITNNNTYQFKLTLGANVYDPTDPTKTITVKLHHLQGERFRGFLIQARKYDSFNYIAMGSMDGPPVFVKPICGRSGNGITHTSDFSNTQKSEISASWKVPDDVCEALKMGDLQFQATAVQSVIRPPYINIYSEVLRMKNDTDPAIIAMCSTPSHSTTMKPTYLLVLIGLLVAIVTSLL